MPLHIGLAADAVEFGDTAGSRFGESGDHEAVDAGLVEAAVEVAHTLKASLELLLAGAATGEDAEGALDEGVDAGGGAQERGTLLGSFLEHLCHGGVFVQQLAGVGHAVGDVAGLILACAHEDFAGDGVGAMSSMNLRSSRKVPSPRVWRRKDDLR